MSYLIVGGIGIVLIFVFIRFTVDDAFITWRYATTFVRTGHWNYSAGPIPPSEGYTNFLYAVLAVVPAALHLPMELFFKLLSLAILVGYLVAVGRARLPKVQVLALLVIACCNPSFMIMLFSGLETVSFAFLVALLFALVYRNGGLGPLGYATALALTLTRPEGILFAFVAMAWSWVITRRRAQADGLVLVCLAWGIYWAWRWDHFGYFWPNTFYVKSGYRGDAAVQLANVVSGLIPALVIAGLVILIAATMWRVDTSALRRLLRNPQNATPFVLAMTSAVVVLGLYHSSNLTMNFVNRFEWQLLFPVAVVVLARSLRPPSEAAAPEAATDPEAASVSAPVDDAPVPDLLDRLAPRRQATAYVARDFWAVLAIVVATVTSMTDASPRFSELAVAGAAIVLAVAVVVRLGFGSSEAAVLAAVALTVVVSWAPAKEWLGWASYRSRIENAHQALGQAIDAQRFEGTVALADAGVMPFEIHQPVLDMDGLAYAPVPHATFTAADLDAAHLDVVVALSRSTAAGSEWISGRGQQVTYAYMAAHGFRSFAGPPYIYGYWLNVWVNRQIDPAPLERALRKISVRAVQKNLRTDAQVLRDGLFDFPFLSNGN